MPDSVIKIISLKKGNITIKIVDVPDIFSHKYIYMARSQNSFIKKQREKKKLMKRKLKEEKKKERQENSAKGGDLADMMAYVDEFGNITSESPEEADKRKKAEEELLKKQEAERRKRDADRSE